MFNNSAENIFNITQYYKTPFFTAFVPVCVSGKYLNDGAAKNHFGSHATVKKCDDVLLITAE